MVFNIQSTREFALGLNQCTPAATHCCSSHLRPMSAHCLSGGQQYVKQMEMESSFVSTLYLPKHYCRRTLTNGFRSAAKVGDELPMPSMKGIFMTVEDSDRYGLYGERADSEWLASTPSNNGYVHFGGEHRIFAVALAHQMHCIRVLRLAIAVPTHPKANSAHASHCLNYLRLYALCNPDLALEKFDPLENNFTSDHFGETHVCPNDWEDAYDVFAKKTKEWLDIELLGKLRSSSPDSD